MEELLPSSALSQSAFSILAPWKSNGINFYRDDHDGAIGSAVGSCGVCG